MNMDKHSFPFFGEDEMGMEMRSAEYLDAAFKPNQISHPISIYYRTT